MSEFEIASLDYQAATLAIREVGLWIAAAHVAVGVLQAAVVGYGVHAVNRANRERARQTDAQARDRAAQLEAQTRAADRRHADAQARAAERHAENMAAIAEQGRRLDALIEGQAEQRRVSDAQTASLNVAVAGLQALLERTAPKGPPA